MNRSHGRRKRNESPRSGAPKGKGGVEKGVCEHSNAPVTGNSRAFPSVSGEPSAGWYSVPLHSTAPPLMKDSPSSSSPPPQIGLPTDLHVARWQAGDETAFEILYRRFAPLILMRVRRNRLWPMLEPKLQPDDVVQEIWARVVPAAKQSFTPSGPGSFLAFLGKITERTLVDLLRTASAMKRGAGEKARPLDTQCERDGRRLPGLSAPETPTSRARVSELEEVAQKALSERELEAWELVEMQDYSAAEAGLAMDCSGSAVRSLLLRGRAKLVLALGEMADE